MGVDMDCLDEEGWGVFGVDGLNEECWGFFWVDTSGIKLSVHPLGRESKLYCLYSGSSLLEAEGKVGSTGGGPPSVFYARLFLFFNLFS